MTRHLIISDLHGDWQGLEAICRAAGVTDAADHRLPDTHVVQLGDLIHGGDPRHEPRDGVSDFLCARRALELGLDVILIGNHELPLLSPSHGFPRWNGMRPLDESLYMALQDLLDRYRPAVAVGGWLLTHAGLAVELLTPEQRRAVAHQTPADVADWLCDDFKARLLRREAAPSPYSNPLFDAVGPARAGRGSGYPVGGIFWCDWEELQHTLDSSAFPFPQIVGHTPQLYNGNHGFGVNGDSWCVDAGAALSGAVAGLVCDGDADGWNWQPLVVQSATGDVLLGKGDR